MYLWIVEFDERWTNTTNGEWEFSDQKWRVTAKEMTEAIGKAESAAIGTEYVDDDGNTQKLVDVRVREVKRGVQIDA